MQAILVLGSSVSVPGFVWHAEEIRSAAINTLGDSIIRLRNGTVTWGTEAKPVSDSELTLHFPPGWRNLLHRSLFHLSQGPNEYMRDEIVDVFLDGVCSTV